MTHATTRIIREEHAALSAMLRSIPLLLGQHRRKATLPDFAVLRAMLFYVDEFPEKRHHRKESEVLFPKLRARRRFRANCSTTWTRTMRAVSETSATSNTRCSASR